MQLHRSERDYYVVEITTDPPLSGDYEASFDEGATWVTGTLAAEGWSWLVAGPDFAPESSEDSVLTDATLTASVDPLLRIKDDPVVDVAQGPPINLWY